MQRYCEADICRRRILLSYFSEPYEKDCGNCDVCKNPPERFDGTVLVQKALSAIVRTEEHIGIQMLIDILRASGRVELTSKGYHLLKTYGAGRDLSYKMWREYIYQMIQLGYIEIDYSASNVLRMTPSGRKVLYGQSSASLATYRELEKKEQTSSDKKKSQFKARPIHPKEATTIEETLLDSLKQLRNQLAEKEQKPAYIIFSDAALQDMVEKKPLSLDAFGEIKGVGQIKQEKYGRVFISLIRFI
jgi:ATP-dependent DNA helicase RecQ